jgi:hypothetical protein
MWYSEALHVLISVEQGKGYIVVVLMDMSDARILANRAVSRGRRWRRRSWEAIVVIMGIFLVK